MDQQRKLVLKLKRIEDCDGATEKVDFKVKADCGGSTEKVGFQDFGRLWIRLIFKFWKILEVCGL